MPRSDGVEAGIQLKTGNVLRDPNPIGAATAAGRVPVDGTVHGVGQSRTHCDTLLRRWQSDRPIRCIRCRQRRQHCCLFSRMSPPTVCRPGLTDIQQCHLPVGTLLSGVVTANAMPGIQVSLPKKLCSASSSGGWCNWLPSVNTFNEAFTELGQDLPLHVYARNACSTVLKTAGGPGDFNAGRPECR